MKHDFSFLFHFGDWFHFGGVGVGFIADNNPLRPRTFLGAPLRWNSHPKKSPAAVEPVADLIAELKAKKPRIEVDGATSAAIHSYDPPSDLDLRAAASLSQLSTKLAEARQAAFEEAAQIAEGPIYKERYRGVEGHNWSAERHPGNQYGLGRMDAAAAIRARAVQGAGHE